jgi:hypothetical protein
MQFRPDKEIITKLKVAKARKAAGWLLWFDLGFPGWMELRQAVRAKPEN